MRITKSLKEKIIICFENYLASKNLKAEKIFLFFSANSFKDFLSKFDLDIFQESSVRRICKFFDEKSPGEAIVIGWMKISEDTDDDFKIIYTFFTPARLVTGKQNIKEDFVEIFLCGWEEEFILKEK